MATSSFRARTVDFLAWGLLAIAVIFAVYVRVRLREFPLERDEGEFAYAGQLLLEGVPPYQLAYNMKLPGTYIAYAALMAVFGQTTAGIHLGLLAVNLATIVLLYRFVRELYDPLAAGLASIVYAILSVSPSTLGMAAHATHFVGFFGLAGTYLLWRHLQSGRPWQAAASGLMMGIAFLMKQQGVFLMVFGGGFLLLSGLLSKVYSRKKLIVALPLFSLAAVLPYVLTCLWLWRAGVWDKFWFWTVEYASKYVQNEPLANAWAYLSGTGGGILSANWPLVVLALAGIVGVALKGDPPGLRSFVFGFLVFSFLCVCPGFYFRNHYFIVMLPAVALFAGVGGRLLWDLAAGRYWAQAESEPAGRHKRSTAKSDKHAQAPQPAAGGGFGPLQAAAVLALVAAFCYAIWLQRGFFFYFSAEEACRRVYMSNPFVEAGQIAEYLKARTSPDDTVAVLGSEPQIFFYARRRSGTGYIYTYGLVEEQPLASKMQKEMIAEIEAAKPKYIVFTNVRCSWLTRPKSETEIFDWATKYVDANYRIVGILEPKSELETIALWDEQVGRYQPPKSHRELRQLDVYWKLTPFPDAPTMQRFCMMPYVFVCQRKDI